MAEEVTTRGFYCGSIRYRFEGAPISQSICYCTCQKATGAESVAWISVPVAAIEFVSGQPTEYETDTDAWRSFCPACGTSLTYQDEAQRDAGNLDVTTGSLDHPEAFPPTRRTWEDERVAWEPIHPLP